MYKLCLGNKIWSNLIRVVRSYERKLGLAWRSLYSKQWGFDFTLKIMKSYEMFINKNNIR